tara:strand:- start:1516 stop:2073 length:558 start_codon:yes stop_codon:yes gene_type:complete
MPIGFARSIFSGDETQKESILTLPGLSNASNPSAPLFPNSGGGSISIVKDEMSIFTGITGRGMAIADGTYKIIITRTSDGSYPAGPVNISIRCGAGKENTGTSGFDFPSELNTSLYSLAGTRSSGSGAVTFSGSGHDGETITLTSVTFADPSNKEAVSYEIFALSGFTGTFSTPSFELKFTKIFS